MLNSPCSSERFIYFVFELESTFRPSHLPFFCWVAPRSMIAKRPIRNQANQLAQGTAPRSPRQRRTPSQSQFRNRLQGLARFDYVSRSVLFTLFLNRKAPIAHLISPPSAGWFPFRRSKPTFLADIRIPSQYPLKCDEPDPIMHMKRATIILSCNMVKLGVRC
jgi:hypothetical protein